MEPALDERGDLNTSVYGAWPGGEPQWSPLSTSGATSARTLPRGRPAHAAMEPALDERGDQVRGLAARRPRGAAMEPALDERGDWKDIDAHCGRNERRNGARSRRAGRPGLELAHVVVLHAAMEPALDERGDCSGRSGPASPDQPQWSPLSTSGATGLTPAFDLDGGGA